MWVFGLSFFFAPPPRFRLRVCVYNVPLLGVEGTILGRFGGERGGVKKDLSTEMLTRVGCVQPFNAFLSGFGATVGQFVLTASLRIQTNPENRREFESVSHER